MWVESALKLLELLRDADSSEQEEIFSLAERIVEQHPFGCTNEDMDEVGALVERLRERRAASR